MSLFNMSQSTSGKGWLGEGVKKLGLCSITMFNFDLT